VEMSSRTEQVVLQTQDAFRLNGTVYGNPETAAMAVVLHPATGVHSGYYAQFARWLADTHAAVVLTYDYRDFGLSKLRPIKQATSTMSDWGIIDQETALGYMLQRFGALPLRVVGHSLGGLWLAFHKDIGKVDRVVAVASGPNFWLDNALSYMPKLLWFWWLGGPLAASILGYLPSWIGLGANLPRGVFWQWRRWCLSPQFSRKEWGITMPSPRPEEARFALTLLPVADDIIIPPAMARRLSAFYPQATVTEDLIVPAQGKLRAVGHLRLFSPRCKIFWPRIAAPLLG
jgi:predicted alpha/beta hydrolase